MRCRAAMRSAASDPATAEKARPGSERTRRGDARPGAVNADDSALEHLIGVGLGIGDVPDK